jgi:putative selenate reductase molybdopterin-binding subunit
VFFADTYDKIGPLGAKAQGECAINAVAPAIANAIKNATGVRYSSLPFTADRSYLQLATGVQSISEVRVEAEPVLAAAR